MIRLCIATYATGNYAPLCDLTDPNKRQYALRHGYDFERNHNEDFNTGVPFFDRHRWHLSLLNSGKWDWMYFLDSDAIFTNFCLRLEEQIGPDDHLIFPVDAIMVQAGGFLAKNSEITKRFFEKLLSRQTVPSVHNQSDQIEMEIILPEFKQAVRYIPQRNLGSYCYQLYTHLGGNYCLGLDRDGHDGNWQPGDFVLHVPGAPLKTKLDVLRRHLELVIS